MPEIKERKRNEKIEEKRKDRVKYKMNRRKDTETGEGESVSIDKLQGNRVKKVVYRAGQRKRQ